MSSEAISHVLRDKPHNQTSILAAFDISRSHFSFLSTMTRTSNPSPEPDWTCSDVHNRLLHEKNRNDEGRQMLWDEYAKIYNQECDDMDWVAPSITVAQIWKKLETYPIRAGEKIRFLDIGCGTGHIAESLDKIGAFSRLPIHLIGLDFNKSMLERAEKRGLYHELLLDDFQTVTFPEGPVDILTASGVFWQGDYGPEALPHALRLLRPGGYALLTVRQKWFTEHEKGFYNGIEKCGCDLIDRPVLPYVGTKVFGTYLLVQKRVFE